MNFFADCTALITGASSGLGEEFARQLAPWSRSLILVARRQDRLESLRGQLLEAHPSLQVLIRQADLEVEAERVALSAWIAAHAPGVDILINNAGRGDHGEFASGDWNRVRAMLDINIGALTHLALLLLPHLEKSRRAALLNVSSVAGFFPLPGMAVYSATKAYVTAFSEALGMELRPRGISVTALCPGPIPTEFFVIAEREAGRVPHYQTMPVFVVTPQEAVRAGLRAVAAGRARVVPGPVLAVAVGAALLVPFAITRWVLKNFAPKL